MNDRDIVIGNTQNHHLLCWTDHKVLSCMLIVSDKSVPKIEMGEREPFLDERDCLAYHQQNEWLPGKDNITIVISSYHKLEE